MTVHHCPKCELRFNWKTEVDDHCWHDHPEFRHEYPAQAAQESVLVSESAPPRAATSRERRHHESTELFAWLRPASPKSEHL